MAGDNRVRCKIKVTECFDFLAPTSVILVKFIFCAGPSVIK